MVKKAILLLSAAMCLLNAANAQVHCYTDEVSNKLRQQYPQEIAQYEAQLKADIDKQLNKMDLSRFKTTDDSATYNDVEEFHIPLVIHIVHDYGQEYVSDDSIFVAVKQINRLYNLPTNTTNGVIPTFAGNIPGTNVKYIGRTKITFHLATKDPQGKPTHGITRHRSYHSLSGGDQAKYDLWPPDAYMNIWIIRAFDESHKDAAAYAYKPAFAAQVPYVDGIIGTLQNNQINYDNTLAHELGHTLNLDHPWGGTNNPEVACGDDEVDDTPPTKGHKPSSCGNLVAIYDTTCSNGFSITYPGPVAHDLFGLDAGTDHTINYPDTNNSQNIMDYTYCSKMFTYLQGVRMRATLRSPIGGRSNLTSSANLVATGALDPMPDLAPIADFSSSAYFICAQQNVNFVNRSWNDTITGVQWTFSNNAQTPTASTNSVANKFSEPGWVTVTLTANGNNTGSNTITSKPVYVADPNATSAVGYFQEFDNQAEVDRYPIFNYFDNDNKWEVVNNAGYYDNMSIRYKNYDNRYYPKTFIGSPKGDYDDFFTPAFDLSQVQGDNTYMNFFSSGAFRVNNSGAMNDTLEISYSTACGASGWTTMARLTKQGISNNGTQTADYTPAGFWDWTGQSFKLPGAIKNANKVYFRFRYRPGTDGNEIGSGNNFYIDRLHFSSFTTDVSALETKESGFAVAPNPTTGSTFVMIKDVKNTTAKIHVTDVTGKVVFSTEARLNTSITNVEIPANYITVKGMYLIQVITGTTKHTEKLVVY